MSPPLISGYAEIHTRRVQLFDQSLCPHGEQKAQVFDSLEFYDENRLSWVGKEHLSPVRYPETPAAVTVCSKMPTTERQWENQLL